MKKNDRVLLTGTDITGTIIALHPDFEGSGEEAAAVQIDEEVINSNEYKRTWCEYLDPVEIVSTKLLQLL